jgi:ligand-binding sensor domain-containing protein
VAVKGKAAQVQFKGASPIAPLGKITSVYTYGKEVPTSAESARALTVRSALLKKSTVLETDFAKTLWLPSKRRSLSASHKSPAAILWDKRPLNPTQEQAVRAIMDDQLVSLIHGGPGTGKTVSNVTPTKVYVNSLDTHVQTVIAASVMSMIAADPKNTVWIVAQSNVAVKNVAEKLADFGFLDFKVLVSKEFHFDW